MSFLGLMTVRAHEAVVADAKRDRELAGRLLGKNVALRSEVAELRAELATMKAKRDQQTRNLKQFRKIA